LPLLGPVAVWGREVFFFIPSLWSLFGSGLSSFYLSLWDACVMKSFLPLSKAPATLPWYNQGISETNATALGKVATDSNK
jgi:hypothetical protein